VFIGAFVFCYGAILAALATLVRWELKHLRIISSNVRERDCYRTLHI